jgi:methionyl-tRNA formyltransferase
MSSQEVYNLYRSLFSFKAVTTSFKGETVKIYELSRDEEFNPSNELNSAREGTVWYCKISKALYVKCADARFVCIQQLSIGKKKIMSAADFNNGFLKKSRDSEKFFE